MITPSLPSVPLGDFPSNRWATLRRDLADFLGSPWAAEAVRLGWSDLDLFGVNAYLRGGADEDLAEILIGQRTYRVKKVDLRSA